MTEPKKPAGYTAVVNKAKEFIEHHWRENLTLERIAAQVFLSPYHFQRIFKAETGETPKEYLTRIRLEGAVQRIRVDLEKTVFEVGMECGFSSQAVFARAFKKKFGVSATEFRGLSFSGVAKLAWEPGIRQVFQKQILLTTGAEERERFFDSITFQRIPPLEVIYLPTTMISEEHLGAQFRRLAERASLYDLPVEGKECFGMMQDFPLHTPLEKCRYKVCIECSGQPAAHPKFFRMSIPGGKYAVFPLRGDIQETIRLCILFFSEWLNGSRYRRREHFLLERFPALPGPDTYSASSRELCIPIEPA